MQFCKVNAICIIKCMFEKNKLIKFVKNIAKKYREMI